MAHLIVNIVVAIGTLAVAVLAIWGDRIRAVLSPPELVIEGGFGVRPLFLVFCRPGKILGTHTMIPQEAA